MKVDERFVLSLEESKIVEENRNLVYYLVHKLCPNISKSESDDKAQDGIIGLIKAIRTFDEKRGVKFSTYASKCIENAILMSLRSEGKALREISLNANRVENADREELSLENFLKDEKSSNLQQKLEDREQIQIALSIILNNFSPVQKLMVFLSIAGKTQEEIAKQLKRTQSVISRNLKRCTQLLKKQCLTYSSKDFLGECFKVEIDEATINISFSINDVKNFRQVLDRILLQMKEMEQGVIFRITLVKKMVTIHLPIDREAFIVLALLASEMLPVQTGVKRSNLQQVYEAIYSCHRFSIEQIHEVCPTVTKKQINSVIRKLVEKGKIIREARKQYIVSEPILTEQKD